MTVSSSLPPTYRVERLVTKMLASGGTLDKSERDAAYRLLNLAWQSHMDRLGLLRYELANARHCFAFPQDLIEGDEIQFQTTAGRKGRRTVVGYKTRINAQGTSWKRFWHFAIQPTPAFRPEWMVIVRTHVLFSEDGKTLWTTANRVQKARRNQCKNWWNDTWRDRLLAAMSWLAADGDAIRLDVGAEEPIVINAGPVEFDSPVSYLAPSKAVGGVAEPDELPEEAPAESDDDQQSDDDENDHDDDEEPAL